MNVFRMTTTSSDERRVLDLARALHVPMHHDTTTAYVRAITYLAVLYYFLPETPNDQEVRGRLIDEFQKLLKDASIAGKDNYIKLLREQTRGNGIEVRNEAGTANGRDINDGVAGFTDRLREAFGLTEEDDGRKDFRDLALRFVKDENELPEVPKVPEVPLFEDNVINHVETHFSSRSKLLSFDNEDD